MEVDELSKEEDEKEEKPKKKAKLFRDPTVEVEW